MIVSGTNRSSLAVRDILPRKTVFREITIYLLINSVFKRLLKNPKKMLRYIFLRTFLIFLLPLPQKFKKKIAKRHPLCCLSSHPLDNFRTARKFAGAKSITSRNICMLCTSRKKLSQAYYSGGFPD